MLKPHRPSKRVPWRPSSRCIREDLHAAGGSQGTHRYVDSYSTLAQIDVPPNGERHRFRRLKSHLRHSRSLGISLPTTMSQQFPETERLLPNVPASRLLAIRSPLLASTCPAFSMTRFRTSTIRDGSPT